MRDTNISRNYVIDYTDKSTTPIIVEPRKVNVNDTPITIYGYGSADWGEVLQENIIHVLENFSSELEPNNPLEGQLWYQKNTRQLNLRIKDEWYAIDFKRKIIASLVSPLDYKVGDLWFNLNDNNLYFVDMNNNWRKIVTDSDLSGYIEKNAPFITNHFDANFKRIYKLAEPIDEHDAVNKKWIENNYVNKRGDILEGPLKANFTPIEDSELVNKEYVDKIIDNLIGNDLYFEYYSTYASDYVDTIDLPFSYDMDTDKLMIFIQGVKQIKNIAYKEVSNNRIQLLEKIRNVDIEIIYLSTKNLKYDVYMFEMRAGTKLLKLPFYFNKGKHSLFVYVQGIKQIVDVAYIEVDNNSILFDSSFTMDVLVEIFSFRINEADIPSVINTPVTFTNEVNVPTPTKITHAVNKKYVDDYCFILEQQIKDCIRGSGGTMTGFLQLNYYPVEDNHATSKHYVDNKAKWEGSSKFVSTSFPDDNIGEDGDFWFVYNPFS